jgi:hypothetical protein
MMSDFSSDYEEKVSYEKYKNLIKDELEFVYDKNHVTPFWEICKGFPLTPCQHYGLEAQVILKDFIINKIRTLYEITVIPSNGHILLNDIKIPYNSCWQK